MSICPCAGDMDSCRFYFDKLQACRVPEAAQQGGFSVSSDKGLPV